MSRRNCRANGSLKEEENEGRLQEHNERHGYAGEEDPVVTALYQVFDNVGEAVSFYRGTLSGPPEVIARLRTRVGITGGGESNAAYVDRKGCLRLPFGVALDIAHKFSAAEPSAVLLAVEATEREWTRDATSGEYIVGLLNRYRAAWALIRQWAGHEAAIAQKESEIRRLERLVWDALYALQKAGADDEAARLRRAVQGK